MEIFLRVATVTDLGAVNKRYEEVDFVPSHEGELIVLASCDGKPAGQGRVGTIDAESGELGGIYVYPGNEGLGIARKVVDFLIKNSDLSILYCLPFENLEGFYGSMGFTPVKDMGKVPQAVIKKHQWCNSNYDKPVLLLERRK
ncbi:GNAT family N-acetyltransferase [Enterobacter sp. KBR-315C3_2022]|uniref:GNAT family N-acetyltransferase n=1 Tax=Enterobacter sp. KBR-315C3_2022 TaxID=3242494 RepID=UPI003528B07D